MKKGILLALVFISGYAYYRHLLNTSPAKLHRKMLEEWGVGFARDFEIGARRAEDRHNEIPPFIRRQLEEARLISAWVEEWSGK